MLKFTPRRNGNDEVTIRVNHYLTREDVRTVLCAIAISSGGLSDELTQAQIMEKVRDYLVHRGIESAMYWDDQIDEEYRQEIMTEAEYALARIVDGFQPQR